MEGMTQLEKINRPYSDISLRKTMHGGGRRGVCTINTPAAALAVEGFSLALIASDWVTCFSCLVQLPGRELY